MGGQRTALALVLTLLFPFQAFAAVAYDTSVQGYTAGGSTSPVYYTITLGGTDTAICVANIGGISGSDTTTNVQVGTGAGTTTMTREGGAQPGSDRYTDLWCSQGTFSGTQTIEVTFSSYLVSSASAYSGTGSIDAAQSSNGGPSTSNTFTTTTTQNNAWLLSTVHYSSGPISAGSGTTIRQSVTGQAFGIGDSNAAESPAGSYSMSWKSSSNATWGGVIVALEPPGTVSTPKPVFSQIYSWW